MKNKILSLVIIAILVSMLFILTGCSNNENDNGDEKIKDSQVTTKSKASFNIGDAVYFNPETGKACTASDVTYDMEALDKEREELTTKTGGMRWYILGSDDKTLTLLLDHRTTYTTKYSEVESQLERDTSTWRSELNPRLITVEEVIKATGLNLEFDGKIEFQFEESGEGNILKNTFAWLYKGYYASNNSRTTFGYWTSNKVEGSDEDEYFVVRKNGRIEANPSEYADYGIRPVITVQKSIFE